MVKEIGLCFQNRTRMAITLVFLVLASFPVHGGKGGNGGGGKPSPGPGVIVTITDGSGNISRDDGDAYSDGVAGVYALINTSNCDEEPLSPACGDFVFAPDADASKRAIKRGDARYLNISLDDPVCPQPPCSTFELSEGVFLNVDGLGSVDQTGGPVNKTAVFHTSIGSLIFNPDLFDGEGNLVEVTRNSNCSWTVTSPAGNVAVRATSDGQTWTALGLYYLPFEMTVELQTCP